MRGIYTLLVLKHRLLLVHAGNNQTTWTAIVVEQAKSGNTFLVLAIAIPSAVVVTGAAAASFLFTRH